MGFGIIMISTTHDHCPLNFVLAGITRTQVRHGCAEWGTPATYPALGGGGVTIATGGISCDCVLTVGLSEPSLHSRTADIYDRDSVSVFHYLHPIPFDTQVRAHPHP